MNLKLLFFIYLFLQTPQGKAQDSIDSLLQEVDKTLKTEKVDIKENKQAKPKGSFKEKTKVAAPPKENKPNLERDEPSFNEVPDEKLNNILSIDKKAEEKSNELVSSHYEIALSYTSQQIGSGYRLQKEEDIFTLVNNETFSGFNASYSVFHPIKTSRFLWNHFSLMGVGFVNGNIHTEKSGIATGTETYQDNIVPIFAGYGASFPWKEFDASLAYGISLEFLNQKGMGYYDSVSDFFYGDFVEAKIKWHFHSDWALHVAVDKKDVTGLFSYHHISGWVFKAGVGLLVGVSTK